MVIAANAQYYIDIDRLPTFSKQNLLIQSNDLNEKQSERR